MLSPLPPLPPGASPGFDASPPDGAGEGAPPPGLTVPYGDGDDNDDGDEDGEPASDDEGDEDGDKLDDHKFVLFVILEDCVTSDIESSLSFELLATEERTFEVEAVDSTCKL